MKLRFCITGILLVCFSGTSLAITVLENAGFEDGSTGRSVSIPGWISIDTPDVIEAGGLNDGGTPIQPDFILGSGIGSSPDGGNMALLRNAPFMGAVEEIQQEISGFTLGTNYRVSFYLANAGQEEFREGLPNQDGNGRIEVSLFSSVKQTDTVVFEGFGSQSWGLQSFDFVATAESSTLGLKAAGFPEMGGSSETARLAIDGVSVEVSPVPLPASFVLLSSAFATLRFLKRRTSRRGLEPQPQSMCDV